MSRKILARIRDPSRALSLTLLYVCVVCVQSPTFSFCYFYFLFIHYYLLLFADGRCRATNTFYITQMIIYIYVSGVNQ